MLNIRDAEDSYLKGKLEWEAFLKEFTIRWFAPMVAEQLMMGLIQLPPEMKAAIGPEALARLELVLKGQS